MPEYDVIVVGAGIAGLGVAGILGKQGIRTLVLEKSKLPGGRAKTRDLPGGWRLDSGTHCVDNGENSSCAQLLHRVGKEITWTRRLEGMMVYDDGKWINSVDYFKMTDEERKDVAALERSFTEMSAEEIDGLDKTSLADFMKAKVTSPKIVEYFSIMGMIQSTLSKPEIILAGEFVSIYREQMKFGGHYGNMGNVRMPLGGVGKMTGTQAAAAAEAGVKFEYATSVKKVLASKSGMTKVITEKAEYTRPGLSWLCLFGRW